MLYIQMPGIKPQEVYFQWTDNAVRNREIFFSSSFSLIAFCGVRCGEISE